MPGIHVLGPNAKTWIAGTSPAMTRTVARVERTARPGNSVAGGRLPPDLAPLDPGYRPGNLGVDPASLPFPGRPIWSKERPRAGQPRRRQGRATRAPFFYARD